MLSPVPITQDLVLIGGGHTHALVLRKWGMRPTPGVRLTLLTPRPTAAYTGMLPGYVAGAYTRDELDIDLVRLARFAGARIVLGSATGLDREAKRIIVPGRRPLRYDIVSIDVGITSELADVDGFSEHGIAAKPLDRFASRWTGFAAKPGPVVIVGAGVGGVELALAMANRLGTEARITMVDRGQALQDCCPAAQRHLKAALKAASIDLREGTNVGSVTAEAVHLTSGETLPAALVVGAAGAHPQPWLAQTGLETINGFVTVDAHLRSTNDRAVYAAGDCAHLSHAPRPKAGVYAVRAAPVLWHNLRADLTGRQRRAFKPQSDFLKLISVGDRTAVGQRAGWAAEGRWLWQLKDRIDRRFMRQFEALKPMAQPAAPRNAARGVAEAMSGQPACAGCGAKVGGAELSAALAPGTTEQGALGDDAAILTVGTAQQVLSADHLRAFTNDPWLLGATAATHALGDIWAMGARAQAALATIIVPPMTPAIQVETVAEIMAAAREVFDEAGAGIVGGHTSQGCELTVGFTVTGLPAKRSIQLSGAQTGDALILSKPIGTGTLLAAEMALAARGADVAHLWRAMAQSQGPAADILAAAHAMTDVTGFGLAGHLHNMLVASRCGAEITLEHLPILPGALELAMKGTRSTLYPANRRFVPLSASDDPRAHLLFDPQTAGGLLAAVRRDQASTLVQALVDKGYTAARIGTVVEGPPAITLA